MANNTASSPEFLSGFITFVKDLFSEQKVCEVNERDFSIHDQPLKKIIKDICPEVLPKPEEAPAKTDSVERPSVAPLQTDAVERPLNSEDKSSSVRAVYDGGWHTEGDYASHYFDTVFPDAEHSQPLSPFHKPQSPLSSLLNLAQPPKIYATSDSFITPEDTALDLSNILNNDQFSGPITLVFTQPQHGSLSIVSGHLIYVPDDDYNGGPDNFQYHFINSAGVSSNTADVLITVTPVGDTVNDYLETNEDTPITANVLTGTNGASADNFKGTASVISVVPAQNGTVSIINGEVVYTPNHDFFGQDSFTYTVANGGPPETATVYVTVKPVNDPPVAVDDHYSTLEDVPIAITPLSLLSNDTDIDTPHNLLTVTKINGIDIAIGTVVELTNGSVLMQADGSFLYTPHLDNTLGDSFNYTVSDGALTDIGLVTIGVTPANDPPIANPDCYHTDEDTTLNVSNPGILVNDSDPESDTLTVTKINNTPIGLHTVIQLTNGSLTMEPDGSFVYTPKENNTLGDTFNYTITDGHGGTATSSVKIDVCPVNDAPVNHVPDPQTIACDDGHQHSSHQHQQHQNDCNPCFAPSHHQHHECDQRGLLFNGNLYISDVDAGSSPVQVTLTAQHGVMTLSGTTGLTFVSSNGNPENNNINNDGTADSSLIFRGSITDINNALNGLLFVPSEHFSGTASLTISTNDLGHTGSGGAKTDTDTVNIEVTCSDKHHNDHCGLSACNDDIFVIDSTCFQPIDGGCGFDTVKIEGNLFTLCSSTIDLSDIACRIRNIEQLDLKDNCAKNVIKDITPSDILAMTDCDHVLYITKDCFDKVTPKIGCGPNDFSLVCGGPVHGPNELACVPFDHYTNQDHSVNLYVEHT